MNPVKRVLRVYSNGLSHLRYSLGPEGVLGIDIEDLAVESTLIQGQNRVDGKLVPNLGLAAAELAVNLDDGLGFEAATEQFVQ